MSKTMKIAKILNTKQVVINAGSNDGLKEGDHLEIIDKFGTDPVIDPDTGESLGTLDLPKGELIVSKIYPKMAIADSPIRHVSPHESLLKNAYPTIAARALGIGTETIQDDLNVDPTQITGGLPEPSDSEIHIGDTVIKRD
ncbi:hypothetical protein DKZ27_06590 [Limosilactobacillus reuteri]|uniref:FlgT C-terminal domain-containing protein n=1 Tax=Limosilactobacillus reuteri TaxID=1598 RepID=UPI000D6F3A31|nr:FlgT C-terminal domain-containing protein [Limosilactobacillus reuteri]PWT30475.1 hypothetical protein DKZ27_06590 [Limosilactobacillus reuteri]